MDNKAKVDPMFVNTTERSDTADEVAKGDYPYEALIYLDYANGLWNYYYELDIDQDYDESR